MGLAIEEGVNLYVFIAQRTLNLFLKRPSSLSINDFYVLLPVSALRQPTEVLAALQLPVCECGQKKINGRLSAELMQTAV